MTIHPTGRTHADQPREGANQMTSVPPTQPPAAKCDYCDQRATTLAGDTNGVLVCEDHVRLFAEREIAAAIDATQPPAAPETDVRLTDREARALADAARSTNLAVSDLQLDAIEAEVERIVAERVRVVESERDAAQATHRDLVSRLGFGDNITEPMADNDTIVAWYEERNGEASEWVESQLWRNDCYAAGHPQDDDCHTCDPRLALIARAESAEAAHAALRAGVEALTWFPAVRDTVSGKTRPPWRKTHVRVRDLRALLAGGEER